jgi:uncharacterized RDD family membrane protein YckC
VSTIPPGWYKDPADPTTQRWWDGEGWLGDPLPADAPPPDGPPPAALEAAPAAPVTGAAGGGGVAGHPSGARPGAGALGQPGQLGGGQLGAPGAAGSPGLGQTAPVEWPMSHRYPAVAPRPHGFMVAGAGSRFMARFVDILAVLLLAGIANIWFAIEFWRNAQPVLNWIVTQPAPTMENAPDSLGRAWELTIIMGIVLTAVWFAYEVPASANSGQTLGKRIFGIKVVRIEADERLGFRRSFWRWFRLAWPTPFWAACYGLPIVLQAIDCLFVATDRRLHQALHDRVTNTVVVQVPRAGRPETARIPVDAAGQPTAPGGGHHEG